LIDLHSHLLPGIDDGAKDLEQSLEMARMAVAGGVTVMACTPHIFPGVYDNKGDYICQLIEWLQAHLVAQEIPLHLVSGADVHVAPDLVSKLRNGEALSLNGSRYVLIEPPHHVLPPRTDEIFFNLLSAGYVPILTHPERMSWIDRHYDMLEQLVRSGAWMQLTAGAILGKFGSRPRDWSERMLKEGLVHIVASDAHDPVRRPPNLQNAFRTLCSWVGETEASNLVQGRPEAVLYNRAPSDTAPLPTNLENDAIADEQIPLWRKMSEYLRGH
jgi:protein-tyrosine phosphatase